MGGRVVALKTHDDRRLGMDGQVEHIVLLLTDGRTVRLDPGVALPLGVAMDALTRAAASVVPDAASDADPMPT